MVPAKIVFSCLLVLATTGPASLTCAEQEPRGSITIDRIADIKYPTDAKWSPDGRTIAFLWDAAGNQQLFVVRAGETPIALTNFPVDPDLLICDIGHFEWAAPDEIILSKGGQLWKVSISSRSPSPLEGFQGN